MAKIEKFEDLKCWQAARELVRLVYLACEEGKLMKDFETKAQIKSAALSSMNNIAEGFGRKSNKEFIRFLDISQSSAIGSQKHHLRAVRFGLFIGGKNTSYSRKSRRNQKLDSWSDPLFTLKVIT